MRKDRADRTRSSFGAFVTALRGDPIGIGALLPSSPALARAIARQVAQEGDGTILELGPGSGAITAALIEAEVPRQRLCLVERNPELAGFLRARFKGVRVVEGDARHLPALMRREGISKVSAVVSSIPLRNLHLRTRYAILRRSIDLLEPSGVFIQYTYSHASPLPREFERRLRVVAECAGYIWLNVPPASIWRFRRLAPVTAQAGADDESQAALWRRRKTA